ncbi:diaminopimelate dehydrogenase [Deltaproteobacteria bacterium OttesenSCG-928-M10]|nr:diaminopimelate dehydrogenase [Deltaproteobacteria bacterium OttesenSCG-928-M10]
MSKITVLVHGLGNIGQAVIRSVEGAPDMECLGVVRSPASVGTKKMELRGLSDFDSLEALIKAKGKPRAAIICGPSRLAPDDAARYLAAGLHTVDSFDIHGQVPAVVERLEKEAVKAGRAAITAAGWDPGTDSVLRALFEAMAPVGTTFTNFGRGRSMGHSVAARAVEGVADAVSLTIPIGGGRHSRLVYVLPESGAAPEAIRAALAADDYFSHDPLDVRFVADAAELALAADNSHGVLMERLGASGAASNQRFSFDMRIDNPALTAQVLAACARAATRLSPGAYTLIDVPPVALLPGDRMSHVARLV